MKIIPTPLALDPWLIQLAFAKPSEAPVVSIYRNGAEMPVPPAQDDLSVAHAWAMAERFIKSEAACGAVSTAIFARAGAHPFLLAAALPVKVRPAVSVGDLPHLYELARVRRNHASYLAAVSERRRLRLLGVEFGSAVLDVRTPENEEAQEALVRHYAAAHHFDYVERCESAGGASISDIISRTASRVRERDRRQRLAPVVRVLLREPGRIVRGPLDTLRAVNEGRAGSVVLIDDGGASQGERREWESGVREVLIATAIRDGIPWDVLDDASSVPDLAAFTCVLKSEEDSLQQQPIGAALAIH